MEVARGSGRSQHFKAIDLLYTLKEIHHSYPHRFSLVYCPSKELVFFFLLWYTQHDAPCSSFERGIRRTPISAPAAYNARDLRNKVLARSKLHSVKFILNASFVSAHGSLLRECRCLWAAASRSFPSMGDWCSRNEPRETLPSCSCFVRALILFLQWE